MAALASLAATLPGGVPNRDTVVVEIRYSRFQLERSIFEPGEAVTFLIRNHDPIDHEFILGDANVQIRHESGTETFHGAVAGEVSIPAGEERQTTYLFKDPGQLILGCHLPRHYDYGMVAVVNVQP